MAIITKIRKKSAWAIGFIALGLGLFIVGGDIFIPDSGNPAKRTIGKIDGKKVSMKDFNKEFDQVKAFFSLQKKTNPSEEEISLLREQAWNELVFKIAYQKQCDILGLQVSEEEMVDMVQGNNIHSAISSSFTNPETGEVDRNIIRSFLQNIDNYPIEQQVAYYSFEHQLLPERLRKKYEGMLIYSTYATQFEAKEEYKLQNSNATFEYLYIPYNSIPDSLVNPSSDQLKAYYSSHKDEFKQEASISLDYVSFPIQYTDEDEAEIINNIKNLVPLFESTSNDSAFVSANSDDSENFKISNPGNLPLIITQEGVNVGKVYGPVRKDERYIIYKLIAQKEDTMYSARASHILFDTRNQNTENKIKTKLKARRVLESIQKGASFSTMARKHGSDGTKNSGGDLGWFKEGAMTPLFNDAVMNQKKRGLVPHLVETEFGYHIIKITEPKTRTIYELASIEKEIIPSRETIDAAYRRVGQFLHKVHNYETFKKAVEDDSTLIRLQALNIPPESKNINNITGSEVRQVIIWAYTTAKTGEVSPIFELKNQYLIAVLLEKKEKGIKSLSKVKNLIERKVNNQLKRRIIMNRLDSLSEKNITQIASIYKNEARIDTITNLSMNSNSIEGIGFSPELVGKIFSISENTLSDPLYDEENGVIIVKMNQMDSALTVSEYTLYKNQIENEKRYIVPYKVDKAMENLANIKKDLYKFY